MKLHDFIFSKRLPTRYYRHIAFWLVRYFFLFQMIFCSMYFFLNLNVWKCLNRGLTLSLYLVLAEIIFTYLIVYWLIPTFFKLHKIFFITGLIFLSALLVIAESPIYIYWFQLQKLPRYSFVLIWECVMIITTMSHEICGLFIACRLFKNYYLKMEERETLIAENTHAEMQLLKAQVHPHFLFNTLNNIYSFALRKSPDAGGLVLKLSDTLKYMINDCEAPFVPLEKELKLIQDYIGLEKVRYGERLDMDVEIKGDYKSKLIVPLLLIPFVENTFKHGASKMLKQPWIKLKIIIAGNKFFMQINNNKPLKAFSGNGKNGIGLKNVQKRLELLYPGKHELIIKQTEDEFLIQLKLPLEIVDVQQTRKVFGRPFLKEMS
jgi:two-component system, LytTR family, sensor kinase